MTQSAGAVERQWRGGVGLGAAFLPHADYSAGPLLALHGGYGLSDVFDAELELTGSYHWLSPPNGEHQQLLLYSGAVGLAYKLDIIEWVPYAALLIGYYGTSDEPRLEDPLAEAPFNQHEVGASLALGVDYIMTRNFGLGARLRYHIFATNPSDAQYFTALIRAEYRFGW